MDAEAERIERARVKNLEYIRLQDEREASQEVDKLLASSVGSSMSVKQSAPLPGGPKSNSSVYVTGLTTYMACRQLEGVCAKLGKVRRIKFYKNERGGLKGDAVVTFGSRATMTKAIERVKPLPIALVKPGVIITVTEAIFSSKKAKITEKTGENDGDDQITKNAVVVASSETDKNSSDADTKVKAFLASLEE